MFETQWREDKTMAGEMMVDFEIPEETPEEQMAREEYEAINRAEAGPQASPFYRMYDSELETN